LPFTLRIKYKVILCKWLPVNTYFVIYKYKVLFLFFSWGDRVRFYLYYTLCTCLPVSTCFSVFPLVLCLKVLRLTSSLEAMWLIFTLIYKYEMLLLSSWGDRVRFYLYYILCTWLPVSFWFSVFPLVLYLIVFQLTLNHKVIWLALSLIIKYTIKDDFEASIGAALTKVSSYLKVFRLTLSLTANWLTFTLMFKYTLKVDFDTSNGNTFIILTLSLNVILLLMCFILTVIIRLILS